MELTKEQAQTTKFVLIAHLEELGRMIKEADELDAKDLIKEYDIIKSVVELL